MSARKTCGMGGCDRDHFALGLCHYHWKMQKQRERAQQAREYRALLAERGESPERDPDIGARSADGRCRLDGCDDPHEGLGLCKRHYRRAARREQTRWAREYRALLAAEEAGSD